MYSVNYYNQLNHIWLFSLSPSLLSLSISFHLSFPFSLSLFSSLFPLLSPPLFSLSLFSSLFPLLSPPLFSLPSLFSSHVLITRYCHSSCWCVSIGNVTGWFCWSHNCQKKNTQTSEPSHVHVIIIIKYNLYNA